MRDRPLPVGFTREKETIHMQILNPARALTSPALLAAAAAFGTTSTASASIYELTFSGTYDISSLFGPDLFGEPGPTAAFEYSITIDTSLDTNTDAILTGDTIGIFTAAHDFYGYSASSIIASSITFGSQTFDVDDLEVQTLAAGVTADFWLDTDISTGATPTASFFRFDDGTSRLSLGGSSLSPGGVVLAQSSELEDDDSPIPGVPNGSGTTSQTTISMQFIPTPGTLGAAAAGLLLVSARRRRA